MWVYLLVFVGAFLFDILPFVGPPAWTIMFFLEIRYGLNIWPVLFVGVAGSTLGRYTMSQYFRSISNAVLNTKKNHDLEFLGNKLSQKMWESWLFIFFIHLSLSHLRLFSMLRGLRKYAPGMFCLLFMWVNL